LSVVYCKNITPSPPETGQAESGWNPDGNRGNRLFEMYTIGQLWE